MTRKMHGENAKAWHQAAVSYRKGIGETVAFLRNGGVSMCAPELPFLQGLKSWCHRAVHLQCAGGEDSLSLLNLGAQEVIGIDISRDMISVAEEISATIEARAQWHVCDVLDAPAELNGSADLVYTGRGAVIWIHDLRGWAQTVARLLKPGGAFYMFEGHPLTYIFEQTASSLQIDPEFGGYFSRKVYTSSSWTAEYVGDLGLKPEDVSKKHELAWPVSEVITALLEQGLRLEQFAEHPDAYWSEFPNLPDDERQKIPNTYSLFMRRPIGTL